MGTEEGDGLCCVMVLELLGGVDDGLVGGDEVLDVDEGVLAASQFEVFESFANQVSQTEPLALAIGSLVADILVLVLEQIQHR